MSVRMRMFWGWKIWDIKGREAKRNYDTRWNLRIFLEFYDCSHKSFTVRNVGCEALDKRWTDVWLGL